MAVTWQWLFAYTFGAQLHFSLRALLFLTAWLIYLVDRFADTITLPADAPISLRHRFCRDHMVTWWIAVVVIFVVNVSLAIRTLDLQMLLLGSTLAIVCSFYLVMNHLLGGRTRPIPMKEKAIGILFAAGTTLGVVGQLPTVFSFEEASHCRDRLRDLIDATIEPILGLHEAVLWQLRNARNEIGYIS